MRKEVRWEVGWEVGGRCGRGEEEKRDRSGWTKLLEGWRGGRKRKEEVEKKREEGDEEGKWREKGKKRCKKRVEQVQSLPGVGEEEREMEKGKWRGGGD